MSAFRTTELPSQIDVAPKAEMNGACNGFTSTSTTLDGGEVQLLNILFAEYAPDCEAVYFWLVAPISKLSFRNHWLLDVMEEVSSTLSPEQIVVGPLELTKGAEGVLTIVTVTAAENAEQLLDFVSRTL